MSSGTSGVFFGAGHWFPAAWVSDHFTDVCVCVNCQQIAYILRYLWHLWGM